MVNRNVTYFCILTYYPATFSPIMNVRKFPIMKARTTRIELNGKISI